MKWYEFLITIPVIIIGAYIRGKIYEHKKNIHHNYSWRKKKK
jgi:Tfp pilus assembly major pilin PilA